ALNRDLLNAEQLFIIRRVKHGQDVALFDACPFRDDAEQNRRAAGRSALAPDTDGDILEVALDNRALPALNPPASRQSREQIRSFHTRREIPLRRRHACVRANPRERHCTYSENCTEYNEEKASGLKSNGFHSLLHESASRYAFSHNPRLRDADRQFLCG